jgi:hypothetical protein
MDLLFDKLSQRGDFAHLLDGEDLVFSVAVDSQTRGIVAAILETRQSWRQLDCLFLNRELAVRAIHSTRKVQSE